MKTLLLPLLMTAELLVSTNNFAACTNQPVLQPSSTLPDALKIGKVVFHTYISYDDGSSNLYMKDFRTNALTQLNQPFWDIEDPMNAHFSPDGRYLVFMGKQNAYWNIFIWQVGSNTAPVNLSNHSELNKGQSEDPKFSADGRYIVYKRNADIALLRLDFTDQTYPAVAQAWKITNNGYQKEESMPYLSPDNKAVYYSQGAGAGSNLYKINMRIDRTGIFTQAPTLVSGQENIAEYYPTVKNNTVYFTRWASTLTRLDYLYAFNNTTRKPYELNINDCNADSSDPMPIDTNLVIFSSTRNGNDFYKLYIGNISTGQVWALDKFGINQLDRHHLGATYSAL